MTDTAFNATYNTFITHQCFGQPIVLIDGQKSVRKYDKLDFSEKKPSVKTKQSNIYQIINKPQNTITMKSQQTISQSKQQNKTQHKHWNF